MSHLTVMQTITLNINRANLRKAKVLEAPCPRWWEDTGWWLWGCSANMNIKWTITLLYPLGVHLQTEIIQKQEVMSYCH